MQILAPVSVGELIDKITILKIKQSKTKQPGKLENIQRELDELEHVWHSHSASIDIDDLFIRLTQVNEQLWDIEDQIRAKEAAHSFDDEFTQLARSVYKQNDLRADIKRQINLRSGSTLIEEKLYQSY